MAEQPWMIKVPFYGKWSMKVTGKNSIREQRMLIESTAGIDQQLNAVAVGQSIAAIDFPLWYVVILSSAGGPGSQASRTRRVPGVVDPDGLVITLYSDDVGSGGVADEDFNDLIVQFTYLDPEVNPPGVPRHPFTMPPGRVRPTRPGRDKRHKCECVCACRGQQRCRCGR